MISHDSPQFDTETMKQKEMSFFYTSYPYDIPFCFVPKIIVSSKALVCVSFDNSECLIWIREYMRSEDGQNDSMSTGWV